MLKDFSNGSRPPWVGPGPPCTQSRPPWKVQDHHIYKRAPEYRSGPPPTWDSGRQQGSQCSRAEHAPMPYSRPRQGSGDVMWSLGAWCKPSYGSKA
jgi:hypothetical protein